MPNDDYILRGDALKAILGVSIYDTIEELEGARTIAENTWADGLYDAYKIIEEEVDAVDVEPVRHGHYIGTEFDGYADGNPVYYEWKCSECDCVFEDDDPKYRYCPNCGAKMDAEPQKEETE
jgi:rubrerythrin